MKSYMESHIFIPWSTFSFIWGGHSMVLNRNYTFFPKILPIFHKICEKNMALEKKMFLLRKRVTIENNNIKLWIITYRNELYSWFFLKFLIFGETFFFSVENHLKRGLRENEKIIFLVRNDFMWLKRMADLKSPLNFDAFRLSLIHISEPTRPY